jgi:Ni,Fe-hydrogenase I cytochrome b subunit
MQIDIPLWVWITVYAITIVGVTYFYSKNKIKKEDIEKAKNIITGIIPMIPDTQAKETLTLVLKYLQYLTGEISSEEWQAFKKHISTKYNL